MPMNYVMVRNYESLFTDGKEPKAAGEVAVTLHRVLTRPLGGPWEHGHVLRTIFEYTKQLVLGISIFGKLKA